MAKIDFTKGPLSGQEFDVPPTGLIIGRWEQCGLPIVDQLVSGRHAELLFESGRWCIRDLNSRNGTMVNDAAVKSVGLSDGDRISIGESVFVFRAGVDASAVRKQAAAVSGGAGEVIPQADHETVLARMNAARKSVTEEIGKVVVGQKEPLEQLMTALFAGGHCVIQGPLATAKTLLVDSIAQVMSLDFKRIQFTPDLMPADISGTEVLEEDQSTGRRVLKFVKGPVFCNMLMADEINRTPPKTQAALLEVMQEKQVTLGGRTTPLPKPFYVLATQVTLEHEGTYPLPEAQQDRFMFLIEMNYLEEDQEVDAVRRSTGAQKAELRKLLSGSDLLEFQNAVRDVKLPEELGKYIVALVDTTRPTHDNAPDFVKDYVYWGAGLRASQYISLGAKSCAAQDMRATVTMDDIRRVITPVLRHRIGLSFRAEVDNVSVDDLIRRVVETVPAPDGK